MNIYKHIMLIHIQGKVSSVFDESTRRDYECTSEGCEFTERILKKRWMQDILPFI